MNGDGPHPSPFALPGTAAHTKAPPWTNRSGA